MINDPGPADWEFHSTATSGFHLVRLRFPRPLGQHPLNTYGVIAVKRAVQLVVQVLFEGIFTHRQIEVIRIQVQFAELGEARQLAW